MYFTLLFPHSDIGLIFININPILRGFLISTNQNI